MFPFGASGRGKTGKTLFAPKRSKSPSDKCPRTTQGQVPPVQGQLDVQRYPKPRFQGQLDVQGLLKRPFQGQLDVQGLLKPTYFRLPCLPCLLCLTCMLGLPYLPCLPGSYACLACGACLACLACLVLLYSNLSVVHHRLEGGKTCSNASLLLASPTTELHGGGQNLSNSNSAPVLLDFFVDISTGAR